ncbi:MAG: 16S rRNA (guanine(527)-N(7))-methyltransferase RsmG [Bacillota bacterium]
MDFEIRDSLDENLINLLKNDKFEIYYNYLIEQNKLVNLTSITCLNEVYYKHFYDSIYITKFIDFTKKKVLDIGAGAGFPSLPIKLISNDFNLTIVDSLKKRIDFLMRLSDKLSIKKLNLIHGRAEEIDKSNYYDIVLARAVAKLNILLEIVLPVLKINGFFIAYKSINYQSELKDASEALKILGGKIENIIEYNIDKNLKHVYLIIKKIKTTPKKYPRAFSKIKKSPL